MPCTRTSVAGRSARRLNTDVGDRVRFTLASIFLPDVSEVLLSAASEVEGTIVDFSDSGAAPREFAIVEMVHKQRVVLAVATLRLAGKQPYRKEQE
ncbi:MAG: hypothetical protein ACJ72H_00080 [Candidatus Sulfotelmatobacter sp.]|jgi:hypothetical protein